MPPISDASVFAHAASWLATVAEASERGEIVVEGELCDGAWFVGERWPSRLAYLEHARNRDTIQAMVAEDQAARRGP